MAGKLNVYDFGGGGVNRVKNPLQLADNELTSAQNAEYVADGNPGGQGALNKRGGIQALTSALNSGSTIHGMIGLPLQTTFTRTLYAALGTETANTFTTTTNGTSWTSTSLPLVCITGEGGGKVSDTAEYGYTQKVTRRIVGIGTQIIYPGNNYTLGSANPFLVRYAGTAESAVELVRIPAGPVSSTGYAELAGVDMMRDNGVVYASVADIGGGSDPRGYVYSMDVETGFIQQVGQHFGSTGIVGGMPGPLVWYQNRLWVGTGESSAASETRIYSITPSVDATWTADLTATNESVCSMAVFRGDLFAGFEGDAGNCSIKRRTAATGAWANVLTGGTTGAARFNCLIVYNDELYAVEFFSGAGDILHIKKSSDGTTWVTDADVDASFGGLKADVTPFAPGMAIVYGSDLYISFMANGPQDSSFPNYEDGFIMRRSGGTWTKVFTGNVSGPMAVLLERS